jgi:hypothetical protein
MREYSTRLLAIVAAVPATKSAQRSDYLWVRSAVTDSPTARRADTLDRLSNFLCVTGLALEEAVSLFVISDKSHQFWRYRMRLHALDAFPVADVEVPRRVRWMCF